MKANRKTILLGIVSCILCMTVTATTTGTYFTTANIWYEHPEKIYSTNYHAGRIIPAGTEVEVFHTTKDRAKFRVKKTGMEFMFTHVAKHSSLSFDEEFNRIFSSDNSFAKVSKKFSAKEKQAVEEGNIELGMSREVVLAAYGYPPSHMTPDLDDDQWTYWVKRLSKMEVTFKDGKVYSVQ